MFARYLFVLQGILLAVGASLYNNCTAVAATVVDSKSLVVSGATPSVAPESGSIGRIKSFYNSASWEDPIPEKTWQELAPLQIQGLRLINVESKAGLRDVTGSDFDFRRLDQGLADAAKYHLRPHIVVGAVPQTVLMKHTVNSVSVGMEVNHTYDAYADALINHVLSNASFQAVTFEVGNEPDTGSQPWLASGGANKGAADVYQAYFKVYSVWANAVSKAALKYPAKSIEIGGPAITPYSLAYGSTKWGPQFISDIKKSGIRMDFFSFHYYGNDGALPGKQPFGPYPTLAGQATYFRDLLDKAGMKNVGLYMTEWGPSSKLAQRPLGVINGSNVGAAWAAEFLISMADLPVKKAVALIFRDHALGNSSQDNPGWPAYLALDGVTPKPLYNTFTMFTMLPDRRVKVSGTFHNTAAIAGADAKNLGVLVAQDQVGGGNNSNELESIKISSLPFQASTVTVDQYLIDGKTSNLFFRNTVNGSQDVGLKKLNETNMPVIDGGLTIPLTPVEGASVRLWMIRSGKP